MQLTISQTKGSQTDAVIIPLPYGDTALCPVRALERWIKAAAIKEGPVFRRIWRQKNNRTDGSPSLPRVGDEALSDRAIALIVQTRAVAAGFGNTGARRPQPQARCVNHRYGFAGLTRPD